MTNNIGFIIAASVWCIFFTIFGITQCSFKEQLEKDVRCFEEYKTAADAAVNYLSPCDSDFTKSEEYKHYIETKYTVENHE